VSETLENVVAQLKLLFSKMLYGVLYICFWVHSFVFALIRCVVSVALFMFQIMGNYCFCSLTCVPGLCRWLVHVMLLLVLLHDSFHLHMLPCFGVIKLLMPSVRRYTSILFISYLSAVWLYFLLRANFWTYFSAYMLCVHWTDGLLIITTALSLPFFLFVNADVFGVVYYVVASGLKNGNVCVRARMHMCISATWTFSYCSCILKILSVLVLSYVGCM